MSNLSRSIRYGCVSNGFVQHCLDDALSMLAESRYSGIGLNLDPHHFDPFAIDVEKQLQVLANKVDQFDFSVVVETGASFLLDPRRKHEPTLVSARGQERRLELMRRAIAIAADIDAEAVSFWSGVVHDEASESVVWSRLLSGLDQIIKEAEDKGVMLAFEPEPGMFIDTLDRYDEMMSRLGDPEILGITLDIGHIRCNETQNEGDSVRRAGSRLRYVQIDDMRAGVHEHLDFGEGEVDFVDALRALREINYEGLVSVELSRHSHMAHLTIPRSIEFLKECESKTHPVPLRQW